VLAPGQNARSSDHRPAVAPSQMAISSNRRPMLRAGDISRRRRCPLTTTAARRRKQRRAVVPGHHRTSSRNRHQKLRTGEARRPRRLPVQLHNKRIPSHGGFGNYAGANPWDWELSDSASADFSCGLVVLIG
jgi:hypothetical protein